MIKQTLFLESFKTTYPYVLLFILSFFQCFVFLNYDEPILTSFLYVIITFLFYLFLAQWNQLFLKVFLIFTLLVCFIIYPTFLIYGEPDFNYVASIYYTNSDESFSYIKVIPWMVYLYLFLLLIYTVFLLKLKYQKFNPYSKFVILAFILFFPIKKLISHGYKPMYIDRYFNVLPVKRAAYFTYQFHLVQKENEYVNKQSKLTSTWDIQNRDSIETAHNFVIVIGESVRKDFLQSYDFDIKNTPFIESSPKIQFLDFLTVGAQTVSSLTRTLALSTDFPKFEINNNIVNLGRELGYKTYWMSNQDIVGYNDSPISSIALYADSVNFIRQKSFWKGEVYDKELLPLFNDKIDQKNEHSQLIFLHMIGSHPSACDRTGGVYNTEFLSKEISCYVESIKNTDKFLAEVYQKLRNTNKPFKLIYFSDHGLSVHEDLNFSHKGGFKENYEVPLLIWGDDIKESQTVESRRMGKDFIYLFSELNKVTLGNFKMNYKFISNEKNNDSASWVLSTDNKLIDFDKLPNNPIPKQ